MRGNPCRSVQSVRQGRSIPACAGEPPLSAHPGPELQVYPRVCGGTPQQSLCPTALHGLSPRVRGNPSGSVMPIILSGSIPACAGEPFGFGHANNPERVYPRVCGGTFPVPPLFDGEKGLSPRVRGNRRIRQPRSLHVRSIPACAGEPPVGRTPSQQAEVYPRVCGGTPQGPPAMTGLSGLSPRVRGNPATAKPLPKHRRSIPACAGEPGPPMARNGEDRVYPRVCGGTAAESGQRKARGGLSPRVRGNRWQGP